MVGESTRFGWSCPMQMDSCHSRTCRRPGHELGEWVSYCLLTSWIGCRRLGCDSKSLGLATSALARTRMLRRARSLWVVTFIPFTTISLGNMNCRIGGSNPVPDAKIDPGPWKGFIFFVSWCWLLNCWYSRTSAIHIPTQGLDRSQLPPSHARSSSAAANPDCQLLPLRSKGENCLKCSAHRITNSFFADRFHIRGTGIFKLERQIPVQRSGHNTPSSIGPSITWPCCSHLGQGVDNLSGMIIWVIG